MILCGFIRYRKVCNFLITTPKEYKEIGEVKMEASLNHPKEEIIKSLKKEAKKIGADAIVGLQELESSDSMKQSWAAKAVVWTDKK